MNSTPLLSPLALEQLRTTEGSHSRDQTALLSVIIDFSWPLSSQKSQLPLPLSATGILHVQALSSEPPAQPLAVISSHSENKPLAGNRLSQRWPCLPLRLLHLLSFTLLARRGKSFSSLQVSAVLLCPPSPVRVDAQHPGCAMGRCSYLY